MKVDKELILNVAKNARLKLSEKEINEFLPQLKDILDYFSKLNEVKVDNVEASFHPIDIMNKVRDDEIKKCLSQEEALANCKNKKDGYIKAPRVV